MPNKYYLTQTERYKRMLAAPGRAMLLVDGQFVVVCLKQDPPEVLAGGSTIKEAVENYEARQSVA